MSDDPPRYFKFHDASVTQAITDGWFMLSSTAYFSALAFLGADPKIADAAETGGRFGPSQTLIWDGATRPGNEAFLREQGIIRVSDDFGGRIEIGGLEVIRMDPPGHILSLAMGEFQTLRDHISDEYGACVEISQPEEFARALWEEGVTKAGTPLRELLGQPKVGPVNYGGRTVDLAGNIAPKAGPFWKDLGYAKQNEFRLFFPSGEDVHDRLLVKLDRAERFVGPAEVWSNEKPPAATAQPELIRATVDIGERSARRAASNEEIRDLLWRWRLERGVRRFNDAPYYEEANTGWVALTEILEEKVHGRPSLGNNLRQLRS